VLVGDGDVFAGMQVMHRDAARVAFRDRVLQRLRPDDENEQRQTARITGACCGQSTNAANPKFARISGASDANFGFKGGTGKDKFC
jgi:hypothetical protein